jgi:hypothetical protein
MPKYTVCSPIKHDGKKYAVGASIDLSRAEAEALPDGTVELPRTEDAAARKAAEKAQKAEAERLAAEQAEAARKAQEEAEAAQKAEADRLAAEQPGAGNSGAQG